VPDGVAVSWDAVAASGRSCLEAPTEARAPESSRASMFDPFRRPARPWGRPLYVGGGACTWGRRLYVELALARRLWANLDMCTLDGCAPAIRAKDGWHAYRVDIQV